MQFNTRALKIMIAESDRTVLEMLQIRLDVAGYHTCVARTGEGALQAMAYARPSALVIDVNLPDMCGLEVLQTLRTKAAKLAFPVLVVGRKLGPDEIRRAVGLGARDCLAKPFSGAELLDRVSRMLRQPANSDVASRRIVYV